MKTLWFYILIPGERDIFTDSAVFDTLDSNRIEISHYSAVFRKGNAARYVAGVIRTINRIGDVYLWGNDVDQYEVIIK